MRVNLILFSASVLLVVAGCQKSQNSPVKPSAKTELINQAQAYFTTEANHLNPISNANPRITTPRAVIWDQAKVVDLSRGKGVLVPMHYEKDLFIRTTQGGKNNFHLSNLAQLLVYQVNGVFHAEVVTGLPDTNYLKYPQGPFSGIVYVEDWSGNSLAKYLYDGKQTFKYVPSGSSRVQSLSVAPIEVCYQLTGYNYSLAEPYGGYAWAEAPVCMPSMVPLDDPMEGYPGGADYGSVAGGGGSDGEVGNNTGINVYIGKNPIANITDYLKCFTNVGGNDHTYTVTVCVDQPVPYSRTAWTPTSGGPIGSYEADNLVFVGHTFLVFTEVYGGRTITRNVGFYPTKRVAPGFTSSQGMLNNDESHSYDISATFQVTNADFFNMLINVKEGNDPGRLYNLNSENCTTFALQTLMQGNIFLPSTIGQWTGGMGNDPGDLGEDIRSIDLLPNMTRSTVATYHFNAGTCN